MKHEHQEHLFGPVFDLNSRILILGSFPSVKSREISFYYGHPQNRFWKVLETVTGERTGMSVEEKRDFLLKTRIAVWDVIKSCDIVGSSDSSIKNVKANDLDIILESCHIRKIFVNGKTAERLYNKYIKTKIGINAVYLPSTSPANAAYNLERLLAEWKKINYPLND